jgi:hypothetical protein
MRLEILTPERAKRATERATDIDCSVCGQPIPRKARSVRRAHVLCYETWRREGWEQDLPRSYWRGEDLIAEVDSMLELGFTKYDITRAVGVQWATICTARRRLNERNERNRREAAQECD